MTSLWRFAIFDLVYSDKQKGAKMAGEHRIKQALDWILAELAENPKSDRVKLIDEASQKFDLSPLQSDFLFSQLVEALRKR